MTEAFCGEIQILGFSYAPYQWAFAAGQTVPIRQNATLFSLIGTTFGGDGANTFQLPNLASRQACGAGQGPGLSPRTLGGTFGEYAVTLDGTQLPAHNHGMNVYPIGDNPTEQPTVSSGLSKPGNDAFQMYSGPGTTAVMHPQFIQPAGAGQPHPNAQPYLGMNFSIALYGVYPYFD